MASSIHHTPVLLEEVCHFLLQPHCEVLWDATVGLGGHSQAFLERTSPQVRLVAFDWDREALARSRERLQPFGERVQFVEGNFAHLYDLWEEFDLPRPDGILFDLGTSALHLEKAERGFSFQRHGPLDMRMSQALEETAETLLNSASLEELTYILRTFGEERKARQIAKKIFEVRKRRPLKSTTELADIVQQVIRGQGRIHPATRTFQALRIAVNRELENLDSGLQAALFLLRPRGRLAVISFHSLEDRIVKHTFRQWQKQGHGKVLTKKPITATEEERRQNPRSRSAKLRVFERGESQP